VALLRHDAIGQIVAQDKPKVVVDLDAVPLMDSSGLGASAWAGVRRFERPAAISPSPAPASNISSWFLDNRFGEGVSIAPTVEGSCLRLQRLKSPAASQRPMVWGITS